MANYLVVFDCVSLCSNGLVNCKNPEIQLISKGEKWLQVINSIPINVSKYD